MVKIKIYGKKSKFLVKKSIFLVKNQNFKTFFVHFNFGQLLCQFLGTFLCKFHIITN